MLSILYRLMSLLLFLVLSNIAYAQSHHLDCKKLNGYWSGTHTFGLSEGKVTSASQQKEISFELDNCNFIWVLSDGRKNYCEIYLENKQTLYKCSFGSRGIVKISGNKISYRNTFTGNSYMVSVKKQR